MVSRKAKLLGGTLFLLGAPSGAALSALDPGKISLGNFLSSSGGALISQPDLTEQKKLEVGDAAKELGLSGQQKIVTPALKEIEELVDLSSQGKLSDNNSGTTIKTIYSETDKEDKAIKLDRESESKFSSAKLKASKYLKDYFSGKSKMDIYSAQEGIKKQRRSKRNTTLTTFSPLTQAERTAFYEIYKIFEELSNNQKELLPKLQVIEGRQSISKTTIDRPKSTDLRAKLQQIGWTSSSQVKYTTERSGGYGTKGTPNHWMDWNKNPYKPFLNQPSEYTDLIDKVQQAEKSRRDYSSRMRLPGLMALLRGPGSVGSTYSGKRGHDNRVRQAQDEFSNRVALKFLEWMDQLGSNSRN